MCHYSCATCDLSWDNCLSCDPTKNRLLDVHKCLCLPNFFENGLVLCEKCDL